MYTLVGYYSHALVDFLVQLYMIVGQVAPLKQLDRRRPMAMH